ncbi:MAG: TIGR04076 family protein [Candidatus Bathyarchaeota archaeon]|jgi:uncharacterized repeat protein (TIGR04076 family)
MVKRGRVKITVLKKLSTKEIFGDNPPFGESSEACRQFDVGQEFIVSEDGGMPEGFCHWAWNDMYKVVTTLKYGGNFSGKEEKEASIVRCCTDGLRPVIFKLERI